METQTFTLAASRFVPVAIGFFGLGTGYFVWGGQALFGFPKGSPEVNRTMGTWRSWMPGFTQLITGVYLLGGLPGFKSSAMQLLYIRQVRLHGLRGPRVGDGPSPLYRCKRPAGRLDGDHVPLPQHSRNRRFPTCADIPVMILFIGLALIYLFEIPTRLLGWHPGARLVGLVQFLTGIRLMYLTYAMTVDLALGAKAWV